MAERYCTDCGSELGPNDAFCASCGRPTHEAAAVATPEADVDVPTPAQPDGPPAPGFAPPTAATHSAPRRRRVWVGLLAGCGGLIGLLVLLVGCLAVLGATSGGGGSGESAESEAAQTDAGDSSDDGSPSEDDGGSGEDAAAGATGDQYADGIATFTRPNYSILASDPDGYAGRQVNVVGQLLDSPEDVGGGEVAFQMWADPANVEYNTVVYADDGSLGLRTDDYVRVRGEVLGSMEGENAFGGAVSAVEVDAEEVERVEGVDAIDPTRETVEVGQTRSSEGLSVTVESIDFGAKHARVRLSASNGGDKTAKLDLDRSKIVQGEDRFGSRDPYDYSVTRPKSGLPPGDQTEGEVIFGRPDTSGPFEVSVAWERGGYMAKTPDPIVFEIGP